MTSDKPHFDHHAADENAGKIRDALDELRRIGEPVLGATPHFKSFWTQAKLVRSLLSDLKPLRREDRDRYFQQLGELCEILKAREADYRLDRRTRSDQAERGVRHDLHAASLLAKAANSPEELRQADAMLQDIREQLASRDPHGPASQMSPDARDGLWKEFHEARQALHFRRVWLQDLDYGQLRGPVAEIERDAGRDNPFEIFRRIRELQQQVSGAFLSKLQRDELRSDLQEAWRHASLRADEWRKERDQKHQEYLERKEARRRKLTETESMFEEMIERKRQTIAKIEENLERNRGREIWNDGYGEKVQGWIEEDEEKLSSIEADIRGLEQKLESVRDQLRELE